jgi:hypothetical protein
MKITVKKVFIVEIHPAKLRQNDWLMDSEQPNEPAALIRWTYSRDEWKSFIRWKKRRKSLFHYLLHRLSPRHTRQTPEITIHPGRVSIGSHHEPFDSGQRRLERINIHDTGAMNVMEITYGRKVDSRLMPPPQCPEMVRIKGIFPLFLK